MNAPRIHRPAAHAARRLSRPGAKNRGSLLIVAMIICAIIGISLVSYIKLSLASLTLADRSFYQTAAMNLTEMGIEEAMYCYNRLDDTSTPELAWQGIVNDSGEGRTWTRNGSVVTARIANVSVGPGATGEVRVYCSNYNPGNTKPVVVAKSTVTFTTGGPAIEKWLHVTLRKRSYWANGMVARNSIDWRGGNVEVDSWRSDHDGDPATLGVAYGSANGPARANATVGTPSGTNDALNVGGGEIHGELLTGGGTVASSHGAVLTAVAPPGGGGWDSLLISSDFDANFPPITVPAPPTVDKNPVNSTQPINPGDVLPRTGDVAWNNVYYYDFASTWALAMSGSQTLTINGLVTFLATAHEGIKVVDLSGNATITVNPTATAQLKIYTDGDIESTGNGFANSSASPSALQILGTNTTAADQTFRFTGNGAALAAIYAPNATVELKGNAEVHGAVVGNTITVTGTSNFHYDESLATASTGNPYGIEKWRELRTADERAEFADELSFN